MRAIVIANGPSLTPEDVNYCKGKGFVIAVNDAYRLAPWSDVLYACDGTWWDHHITRVTGFDHRMWTCSTEAAKAYGLRYIGVRGDVKWSGDPSFVAGGGNSGFQALNLAYLWGFREIVLLGFDYKYGPKNEKHWFGSHPSDVEKNMSPADWVARIGGAMPDVIASGTKLTNCSRATAIDSIERKTLEEALC